MCHSTITNALGTSKQSQLTDIYRTRGEMIVAGSCMKLVEVVISYQLLVNLRRIQ